MHSNKLGRFNLVKEANGWFAYSVDSKGNVIGAVCIAPAYYKGKEDAIAFIKAKVDSSIVAE